MTILNIFLIIAAASLIGGSLNYFIKGTISSDSASDGQPGHESSVTKNNWFLEVLKALVAAAIVPVFLELLQSDIIAFAEVNDAAAATSGKDGTLAANFRKGYILLTGFCLIAAANAEAFIRSLSTRVLGLKELKQRVDSVNDKITVVGEKMNTIPEQIEKEIAPKIKEITTKAEKQTEDQLNQLIKDAFTEEQDEVAENEVMEIEKVVKLEELKPLLNDLVEKTKGKQIKAVDISELQNSEPETEALKEKLELLREKQVIRRLSDKTWVPTGKARGLLDRLN